MNLVLIKGSGHALFNKVRKNKYRGHDIGEVDYGVIDRMT